MKIFNGTLLSTDKIQSSTELNQILLLWKNILVYKKSTFHRFIEHSSIRNQEMKKSMSYDNDSDDDKRSNQRESVRMMSQHMRDKRRDELDKDKQEAMAIENQMKLMDERNEKLFAMFNGKRQSYFRKINYFLQMGFSSKFNKLHSTTESLTSTDATDHIAKELSNFFTPTVTATMPEMYLYYSKPSKVENGRFTFNGTQALLTYTEGLDVFCSALAHSSQPQSDSTTGTDNSLAEKLLLDVRINPISFIVQDTTVTCSYKVSTVNAVLCGGVNEVEIDGRSLNKT